MVCGLCCFGSTFSSESCKSRQPHRDLEHELSLSVATDPQRDERQV